MISIIVPIYNAEQFLHRCIDSILAQSYTDFELLLVDDGSTDSSGIICDEYTVRDNRVRVFHKANGGVSSARNIGLDNAQGCYITFCDADDYVEPNWLSVYSDAIVQDVDLAIQGLYYIHKSGEKETKRLPILRGYDINSKRNLIVELFNQGVYGYPVTKLFRRDIIEANNIRFDIRSRFREDAQFFSKYLEYVKSFICIDREDYYYFLPDFGKGYNGDLYYSIFPMLQSLDVVFERNIPIEICQVFYSSIKTCALQNIHNGKKLTPYHIDIYERMSTTLGYNKGVIKQFINSLILYSNTYPFLSRILLDIVRLMTK